MYGQLKFKVVSVAKLLRDLSPCQIFSIYIASNRNAIFDTLFKTFNLKPYPPAVQVAWLSCCVINGDLMCLVSMPKSSDFLLTEVNIK